MDRLKPSMLRKFIEIDDLEYSWKIENVSSGKQIKGTSYSTGLATMVTAGGNYTLDNCGDCIYGVKYNGAAGTLTLYNGSSFGSRAVSSDVSGNFVGSWNNYGSTANQWRIRVVNDLDIVISNAGYATTCLPLAVTVPEGVTLYGAHDPANGSILLDEFDGDILAAETPVILAAPAGTYTFSFSTEEGTAPNQNILKGTLLPTAMESNSYYALGNMNGIGFYVSTVDIIPANKAYLLSSDLYQDHAASSKSYLFSEGQTTSIDTVVKEEGEKVYYDLSGRKIAKPTRGIYIVNGKKEVIK